MTTTTPIAATEQEPLNTVDPPAIPATTTADDTHTTVPPSTSIAFLSPPSSAPRRSSQSTKGQFSSPLTSYDGTQDIILPLILHSHMVVPLKQPLSPQSHTIFLMTFIYQFKPMVMPKPTDGSLAATVVATTQKGLNDKVLDAAKMADSNSASLPCKQGSLGADLEGALDDGSKLNYPSIAGMLMYLANNTRPDIAFAVSQVACFTSCPKESHAVTMQHIL